MFGCLACLFFRLFVCLVCLVACLVAWFVCFVFGLLVCCVLSPAATMDRDGSSGSWESLKITAKGLKSELDTKMQELGRLNRRLCSASQVDALEGQIQLVVGLREEVERGLQQLEEATDALARVASTSAQSAQALRLRETHQEMARDFKRVAQSIDQQYQHARLLPRGRVAGAKASDDVEECLMRERSGLNSSISMAEEIIGQATATRDMLFGQRGVLGGVSTKMRSLESIMPGINSLIDKISDRKNKERVVLSLTVACCCFFTIWYKFL